MTKDIIITLDNDKEYYLLDETILDNKKYFYAVGVDKNEEPTKEYIVLEEIQKGEKIFIKKVKDKEMLKLLVTLFTNNYLSETEKLEENESE